MGGGWLWLRAVQSHLGHQDCQDRGQLRRADARVEPHQGQSEPRACALVWREQFAGQSFPANQVRSPESRVFKAPYLPSLPENTTCSLTLEPGCLVLASRALDLVSPLSRRLSPGHLNGWLPHC